MERPVQVRQNRNVRFGVPLLQSSLLLLCIGAALLAGCSSKKSKKPLQAAPPPTFTGPKFLLGTVSSLCQLRGFEPELVSGYGIVVNLNGTGSAEVPARLRNWLINEMRKQGVGQIKFGMRDMPPTAVLASPHTTVVAVEGLIPPGAVVGTPFDVLVSAVDSQTTSLEGGELWTTDLSVSGIEVAPRFSSPQANARGPMFIDPFDDNLESKQKIALQRQAVVVGGGVVSVERKMQLVLNTPAWRMSRVIADRINERFPANPSSRVDRNPTAVPKTDQVIDLHIPRRFANNPERFVQLIQHLYLQRSPDFEPEQAQRLADVLLEQPIHAASVALAWEVLGATALPVIRSHYDHPAIHMRLTALEAGSRLQDELASQFLITLAQDPSHELRLQAARMLVNLPRSIRGSRQLHDLLDDDDIRVRIAAYESLAAIADPMIHRVPIGKSRQEFKFVLDLVPSSKPLVYITQQRYPRIVIFNSELPINAANVVPRLWENRLMIRGTGERQALQVFYQPRGQSQPKIYEIAPTLANLIFLMAHDPANTAAGIDPTEGMNLSYSQVVGAVYQLCKQGAVAAGVELNLTPMTQAILAARERERSSESRPELSATRPETEPSPDALETPAPDASATTTDASTTSPSTTAPAAGSLEFLPLDPAQRPADPPPPAPRK